MVSWSGLTQWVCLLWTCSGATSRDIQMKHARLLARLRANRLAAGIDRAGVHGVSRFWAKE